MRTLSILMAASLMAAPLVAQGWIEPLPGHPGFGVQKTRTVVSVRVSGRIAQVQVEEWFRNGGSGLGEGDYLYPLPGEAVFSNFSLFQGDEELRGETMDAKQARTIYEEIVRRKKDPALIELVGHGLIRARVFPINPGETRKITLRYTQLMERAGDALQFRYAAGGRYGIVTTEGVPRARRGLEDAPLTFTLTADSGSAFAEPFSPTHSVLVTRTRERLSVRPERELRGDFALFLPLARPVVGISVVTHRPGGEDGYFMLTLSPGDAGGRVLPRDVTAVMDISGSMSGSKIEQAKDALRQLLNSLSPNDRFRLVAFSNRVRVYRPEWTRAAGDELAGARGWIDGLQANGGTNIEGALREAFRLSSSDGRLPIVVFLTDGLPSVGERNPEAIAEQADRDRGNARVFAFGVGYDVNTYLLDRLSAAGRGTTEYVEPGEDVEQAIGTLAAKVQHPVLADLEIARSHVDLREIYPSELPDLFRGEELVVFGRYRPGRRAAGELALTGRRNGRTERFATRSAFPDDREGNDYIPRLWASRKIGELAREIRLHGANPELEREIRETALRYGLLSDYTSYLVQEPEGLAAGPGGWRQDASNRPNATPGRPSTVPAAPSEASGALAVAQAEESRMRREVKSQADLVAADEIMLQRGHLGQSRHVAGRLFVEKDAVWTDLRHNSSLNIVSLEPFSEAYFAVLQALPELEAYLKEFDHVLVAGEQISIQVAPHGQNRMDPSELRRIVREFRGR
jgi:Ca-activated chloride channel family protein